jgi:hypothetical protein
MNNLQNLLICQIRATATGRHRPPGLIGWIIGGPPTTDEFEEFSVSTGFEQWGICQCAAQIWHALTCRAVTGSTSFPVKTCASRQMFRHRCAPRDALRPGGAGIADGEGRGSGGRLAIDQRQHHKGDYGAGGNGGDGQPGGRGILFWIRLARVEGNVFSNR